MSHFRMIGRDFPVERLLAQVDANRELWGSRKGRCEGESPHRETTDIWLRYARPNEIHAPGFMDRPHESTWYPESMTLTGVFPLIDKVSRCLGGHGQLGGVLMTRIPSGKQVYPHHDRGSWHSEFYDLKVWLVLRANEQCVNFVEDEAMVWKPGEAWSHDNLLVHSVRNDGDTERIVLIACFRRQE